MKTLHKKSERQWYYLLETEALAKAQAMADDTDARWYVNQVESGKYEGWFAPSTIAADVVETVNPVTS